MQYSDEEQGRVRKQQNQAYIAYAISGNAHSDAVIRRTLSICKKMQYSDEEQGSEIFTARPVYLQYTTSGKNSLTRLFAE